ncbi:MAG: hypothetical protein JNM97_05965 [Rhodoferax sp.]|nr:hypothetical protein [Rhodoferax sp.]
MTTQRADRLDVYYGDALVGCVHDSEPLGTIGISTFLTVPVLTGLR